MAYTRRMLYGVYYTDGAVPHVVRVEADRFANGDFAWTAPAAGDPHNGYGTLKPRRVFGVSADGLGRSEVVPDIGAPIWTTATTFTVEDAEGVEVTYTVTSRRGELLHLSR